MKRFLLAGLLICSAQLAAVGQEQPQSQANKRIDRESLVLRPNSRDYTIVRKGNNHQRIIQMRTQAMIRHRQAMLNRKMAMDRHRSSMQQRMIRQQHIRQRMIRQHGMHK